MKTFLLALLVLVGAPSRVGWAGEVPGPSESRGAPDELHAATLFARQVWPIFQQKCLPCHGADPQQIAGGFDLRTGEGFRRGGDSGWNPREIAAAENPVLHAIGRQDALYSPMPPKENDRLTVEQIDAVRQWLAAGGAWPDAQQRAQLAQPGAGGWDEADGVTVATSGGLSDDWTHRRYAPENLWAYRPLSKPQVPALAGHPVDAFLAARLPAGVQPAPLADRGTLIRRATFDLIGLPPGPEELAAFVDDPRPDAIAFAAVVERLLASPHYGERWGQHWLDVVRYADSGGHANDYARGNAWRYRDYVIRAFNEDKPYDEFIREQVAGDELRPATPERLVAAGFLRMGPWELTAMEVPKIARQRFLDDVTNSIGEVFLAHSLQCARCHDHKFDPVPTRDYYALQAVFATTQLADRPAPFLPQENVGGFDERKYLEQRQARFDAALEQLRKKEASAARQWCAERGLSYVPRAEALKRGVPEDQLPPRFAGFGPQDYGLQRIATKGLERLKWERDRYEPLACSVYSGRSREMKSVTAPLRLPASRLDGELEQVAILAGGDPLSPTQVVPPGVLSATGTTASIPDDLEGRRRALAEWLAAAENPLTARVLVNRLWHWHFGRGLAENPNNFGATGKKPTHPELLDWLAATFIERGWSVKAMQRLIVTSEAYRRAAEHSDERSLSQRDPEDTSYAVFRPRRLSAEEIRDAMLRISGELNPVLGGIPVRPEVNPEVALQPRQVMGTYAEAWQPSPRPAQRHRRSIYVLKLRGQRDPFFEVFNSPNPDTSCEMREASSVTPQVFSLLNSKSSYDRALAFASRLGAEADSPEATLARAVQLAFQRAPRLEELAALRAHWDAMAQRHRGLEFRQPPLPCEIVREALDEHTGEPFQFLEPLESVADFQPDVQPGDVDASTRGLAEVCLVLFNANEFLFVY